MKNSFPKNVFTHIKEYDMASVNIMQAATRAMRDAGGSKEVALSMVLDQDLQDFIENHEYRGGNWYVPLSRTKPKS